MTNGCCHNIATFFLWPIRLIGDQIALQDCPHSACTGAEPGIAAFVGLDMDIFHYEPVMALSRVVTVGWGFNWNVWEKNHSLSTLPRLLAMFCRGLMAQEEMSRRYVIIDKIPPGPSQAVSVKRAHQNPSDQCLSVGPMSFDRAVNCNVQPTILQFGAHVQAHC